jgi:AraC-like DNA-binding protein
MIDQGSAPEWNHPGIPAFPGTPGEVGVLVSPGRALERCWPPGWAVTFLRGHGSLMESWERCSVFVVWPGEEEEGSVLELLEALARLRARAPVFVARELGRGRGERWGLSGQSSLALQGLEVRSALRPEDLALSIHEGVAGTVVRCFGHVVLERVSGDASLRAAVRLVAQQTPSSAGQALPGPAKEVGFVRRVDGLARRVGCTDRHLRKQARQTGLSLNGLVRWSVLLHGLALFQPTLMSWTTIAVRLGFSDNSALATQFRRTAGECPMRLARRPWRLVLARALNDVTNRGRKGEEGEGPESP